MTYLISQIWLCLLLTALIAGIAGWLLRGGCKKKIHTIEKEWQEKVDIANRQTNSYSDKSRQLKALADEKTALSKRYRDENHLLETRLKDMENSTSDVRVKALEFEDKLQSKDQELDNTKIEVSRLLFQKDRALEAAKSLQTKLLTKKNDELDTTKQQVSSLLFQKDRSIEAKQLELNTTKQQATSLLFKKDQALKNSQQEQAKLLGKRDHELKLIETEANRLLTQKDQAIAQERENFKTQISKLENEANTKIKHYAEKSVKLESDLELVRTDLSTVSNKLKHATGSTSTAFTSNDNTTNSRPSDNGIQEASPEYVAKNSTRKLVDKIGTDSNAFADKVETPDLKDFDISNASTFFSANSGTSQDSDNNPDQRQHSSSNQPDTKLEPKTSVSTAHESSSEFDVSAVDASTSPSDDSLSYLDKIKHSAKSGLDKAKEGLHHAKDGIAAKATDVKESIQHKTDAASETHHEATSTQPVNTTESSDDSNGGLKKMFGAASLSSIAKSGIDKARHGIHSAKENLSHMGDSTDPTYFIKTINSISRDDAQRLQKMNIRTTNDLLEKCSDDTGIQLMSKSLGKEEWVVRTWVSRADLMRIESVDEDTAELFELAGIDSVKALVKATPDKLIDKITLIHKHVGKSQQLPDLSDIQDMIADAEKLV